MIYDALSHLQNYRLQNAHFPTALKFINKRKWLNLEPGTIPVAEGIYAVVSEYQTADISTKFIECHRRFIDIQIVIEGIEHIGICPKKECTIKEAYNREKDLEKLVGDVDLITLRPGYFAVFFPQDGHMPGLKIGNKENRVKKLVLKVPV
ncbi:MAG: YhcH/YjgK/YiaL family protein [Chitinivibrionales bacterium]|nr:YhcH/YjgK/YiaL family protein [Chitinivibrionales bacterium]